MPLLKSHLIDKIPWWGAALIALGYLVSFAICVGVGAAGPGPSNRFVDASDGSMTCSNPLNCTVTTQVVQGVTNLNGYYQALWVVMSMARPYDLTTGLPVLTSATSATAVTVPIDFVVNAFGDDNALATDIQKTATLNCPGSQQGGSVGSGVALCSYALVFSQPFLYYTNYAIQVSVINPWAGFVSAGVAASNINTTSPVTLSFYTGTINPAFTRFQINSKYTFFCLSLILFAAWVYLLYRGAGGRDPENPGGRRLSSTQEQVWLTVLGAWLIWANDPFAAVSLTQPSFAASGFYAFCATTFLVLLLLYWMVIFDLARDPSRNGQPAGAQPLGATAQIARRCSCSAFTAAVLFWAPKLVWCIVTWMLVLSFYMITLAYQLSDPTFNLFTAVPLLQQYFFNFTATWGALYVIYVSVMLISSVYQCRVIAPSSRYILAITLVTLAASLAGLFLQGVLPVSASNSSVVFMTAQGAANIYIYFLMIAYAPVLAHTAREATEAQVRDEEAAARGGSTLTVYGGIVEAPPKLKALSEAYSQTDESSLQPGTDHGDCITMPITLVGVDFGAGGAAAAEQPPPGLASGVGGAFSFGAAPEHLAAKPARGAGGGTATAEATVSDDPEGSGVPGAASDMSWK